MVIERKKAYLLIRTQIDFPYKMIDIREIFEIIKSNNLIFKLKKLKLREVICLPVKGLIVNTLNFQLCRSLVSVIFVARPTLKDG